MFGKKKSEKDRLKDDISNLMGKYDREEIDGATYMKNMLDLSESYQKKRRKK